MTETTDDAAAFESAAEAGEAAGLPSTRKHCPRCDAVRDVQQIVDDPDDARTAPKPYACLTCGCEFVADSP